MRTSQCIFACFYARGRSCDASWWFLRHVFDSFVLYIYPFVPASNLLTDTCARLCPQETHLHPAHLNNHCIGRVFREVRVSLSPWVATVAGGASRATTIFIRDAAVTGG